jgi:uncharacterized protein (DUF433 family)
MIPKDLEGVLVSTPDILAGGIRFRGTRVPVQALLDVLRCGQTVDDFLAMFPGVTQTQVLSVIEWEDREARKALGLDYVSL